MNPAVDPIVVTGMGAITAAGRTLKETWDSVLRGSSCVLPFNSSYAPKQQIGLVRVPMKSNRTNLLGGHLDRCHQLLLVAATEALSQARLLEKHTVDRRRVAIVLGTSLGGMRSAERFILAETKSREKRVELLRSYPMHICADILRENFEFCGPQLVFSTACTASAVALAYSHVLLSSNQVDVAVVGGADPITLFSLSGFSSINGVSAARCAPFSYPPGLNVGEGAAIIVLERKGYALRRGATPIAAFLGFGLSTDAYHPTSPDPSGRSQTYAAKLALRMAGLSEASIDYVNAHGTGTIGNDSTETRAIEGLFGRRAKEVPVSSIKGTIGHTLGAAGAIESAVTIMAISKDELPPTANFVKARAGCQLDYVPNRSRKAAIDYAMSLNAAFGGNNSALLFAKPHLILKLPSPAASRRVVVTGVGLISPIGNGPAGLVSGLKNDRLGVRNLNTANSHHYGNFGLLEGFDPSDYTRADLRRMDRVGQLTVCATEAAFRDAGLSISTTNQYTTGAVIGTMHGSVGTCEKFFRPVANKGRPDPSLFPNTVLNAGVGLACTHLRLKGCSLALSVGVSSGLSALGVAFNLIRTGHFEVILAGGVDELTKCTIEGYTAAECISRNLPVPFGLKRSGMVLGEGACVLALESLESAIARKATIYGEICSYATTSESPKNGGAPGSALTSCISDAVEAGKVSIAEVDIFGSGAISDPEGDLQEAKAINDVFGQRSTPVYSLASRVGACAATGTLSVAAALLGMKDGFLPTGVRLADQDPRCRVSLSEGPAMPGIFKVAVVTSSTPSIIHSSIVLRATSGSLI